MSKNNGSRQYRASERILKVCILGEGGVGKTTLTKRIITGLFDSTTRMTIGVDFHLLKTSIFDPLAPEDQDDVPQIDLSAQIWDFAGEERFRFILARYCKGAMGGLLCFDLSRYSTTKYIDEWFEILLCSKHLAAQLAQGDISLEYYKGKISYKFGKIIKEILEIHLILDHN